MATTVRDAIEEYRYSILRLSPKSQKEYMSKLNHFATWCEENGVTLDKVKQAVLRRFTDYLRTQTNPHTGKPIAAVTIHGYCRVLKAFLGWCSREEDYEDVVSEKISKRIEMPIVEKKIIEVFTDDHIKSMFASCEREYNDALRMRDKAILAVLLDTGIRASELVGLTLENVHLDINDAYLKVLGKGNKWREVALGKQALQLLRKYITRHRHASSEIEAVFLNRSDTPITVSGLDQLISRLGEWARVEGVRCSPHTFRHTYAVRFLQVTGDVYRLSRLMGHTSVSVTEVYLRAVKAKDARHGMSVLDRMK